MHDQARIDACDRCDHRGILKSCDQSDGFVDGFKRGTYCMNHGNWTHACYCKHPTVPVAGSPSGKETP